MTMTDGHGATRLVHAHRTRMLWRADPRANQYYPHGLRRKKAQVLELIGRWDEEEAVLRENLSCAVALDDRPLIATSEFELGGVLYLKGANAQALTLYQHAYDSFNSRADTAGIGLVMGGMGCVHRELGDLPKAMECFTGQLRLAKQQQDRNAMSRAFGNLGIVHCLQEKFEQAMGFFQQKLEIAERLGDQESAGATVGNIGNVHKMLGEPRQALECYDRQLAIARMLGDKRSIGAAVGNSGVTHTDQGDYPRAIACLGTFLEIATGLGDKRGIGIAAANLGIAHKATGDYAKSEKYYDLAIATGRKLNARQYLCGYLSDKADLCLIMKRLTEAGILIREALAMAEEIGEKPDIDKCLNIVKRIQAAGDLTPKPLS